MNSFIEKSNWQHNITNNLQHDVAIAKIRKHFQEELVIREFIIKLTSKSAEYDDLDVFCQFV